VPPNRCDRLYKRATNPARPIIKPALPTHALADLATPLSLTGALGEAVPLDTVPLVPGRPEVTVPLLGALPAAVVCATRVLATEDRMLETEEASVIVAVEEEASVITTAEGEASVIAAAEEVASASDAVGESVIGPVAEPRVVKRSQLDTAVSVSRALQSTLLELDGSASEVVWASAVVEGAAVADAW
jgi:hypothetical protein